MGQAPITVPVGGLDGVAVPQPNQVQSRSLNLSFED